MFSSQLLKEWIGRKPFTVLPLEEWVQWRESNGIPWVFLGDLRCPICRQESQRDSAVSKMLRVEDHTGKQTTNIPLCDDHAEHF